VDEHGTDVDPRAEAALEALRRGRDPSGASAVDRLDAVRRVLELVGQAPRRAGLLAGVVLGAVVLVALAWLALRPVGSGEVLDDSSLFSGSAVTTDPSGDVGVGAAGQSTTTTAAPVIVVHAAGAVTRPGLYRLPRDARVADLLDQAGGPTPDTDLDRVNLAAPLADGQRLYLPRRGESEPPVVGPDGGTAPSGGGASPGSGAGPGSGTAGPIDLNRATAEELDTLPGIGPATAAAIIDHRERNGPFTSIDGLLDVRGIGPAKLEGLRDLVAVG
jgi:competence protein ComEA